MENKQQCPEFPYFGATYPDARCVDGYLWDLDKCTDDGGLYGEGEHACPFCNSRNFIKDNTDPLNGITKKMLVNYIKKLKEKYGYAE